MFASGVRARTPSVVLSIGCDLLVCSACRLLRRRRQVAGLACVLTAELGIPLTRCITDCVPVEPSRPKIKNAGTGYPFVPACRIYVYNLRSKTYKCGDRRVRQNKPPSPLKQGHRAYKL